MFFDFTKNNKRCFSLLKIFKNIFLFKKHRKPDKIFFGADWASEYHSDFSSNWYKCYVEENKEISNKEWDKLTKKLKELGLLNSKNEYSLDNLPVECFDEDRLK